MIMTSNDNTNKCIEICWFCPSLNTSTLVSLLVERASQIAWIAWSYDSKNNNNQNDRLCTWLILFWLILPLKSSAKAAKVVTTIAQNNPHSQQLVMEANGLEPLLSNFTSNPDVTVWTKALGAISCIYNKDGKLWLRKLLIQFFS